MTSIIDPTTAPALAPCDAPRTLRHGCDGIVLVCGKCLKRHENGKALRRAMKAQVKTQAIGGKRSRKTRVVKTSCLGLCPRGAVVTASAVSLSAGDVVLVRHEREISAAVARLLSAEELCPAVAREGLAEESGSRTHQRPLSGPSRI